MKRTITVDEPDTPEPADTTSTVEVIENFPPAERPKTKVYCTMRYGDITISVMDVTRPLALYWLKRHNTHNRNLRPMRRDSYARDMLADQWMFNGDALRFAADGTMLDGQHRIDSYLEATLTKPDLVEQFLVIEGLPTAAQDTMDIGAMRQFADQLKLAGYHNPTMLAAVARRLCVVKAGMNGIAPAGRYSPTKREMRKFIDEHLVLIGRAVDVALRSHAVALPAAPSTIGAAYFLCAEKDSLAAELFFVTKLIESIGLEEGEPARTLQIRLQKEANTVGQMDPELVFRYAILAWNRWRKGAETLDRLQKPRNGWPSYATLVIE